MNRLIDKTVILFLCLTIYGLSDTISAPVIGFLVSCTFSAAAQFCTGKKQAWTIIGISSLMCLFIPCLIPAAPVMLYDALWEKKPWLAAGCLSFVIYLGNFTAMQIMLICSAIVITVLLYIRTTRMETNELTLKSLRDNAVETELSMSQKNKALLSAQNNEVYLATLKERNRIAREIHDNVGHMLTRSILQVGALLALNKDGSDRELLESLKQTLDSAMNGIRSSVHDLHDDSINLNYAVGECIKTVKDKFKVSCEIDVSDEIPKTVKLCIVGVVKESLSNAAKHSNGDKVKITIREHPAFYQLAVEDNGCCSDIKHTGIGLENMRDRAESIGGIIKFTPSSKGFRVFMSVPKGYKEKRDG